MDRSDYISKDALCRKTSTQMPQIDGKTKSLEEERNDTSVDIVGLTTDHRETTNLRLWRSKLLTRESYRMKNRPDKTHKRREEEEEEEKRETYWQRKKKTRERRAEGKKMREIAQTRKRTRKKNRKDEGGRLRTLRPVCSYMLVKVRGYRSTLMRTPRDD